MSTENSAKLAVLIDADNASADIVDVLLEEIAKYGIASVKRIYGDWSSGLKKWKDALLPHAITPVQQFAYTKGKNATDMAMVIDAMDLLYSDTFDGFCIVSSDSDFTRLASRVREQGLTVYGFGQKKTPEAFRKACDKFIYTENLLHHVATEVEDTSKVAAAGKPKRKSPQELKQDSGLMNLIRNAVKEHADDDGWASLGVVGQYINKVNSDFDARNWGYAKLSSLIRAIDLFETQIKGNHLWLRSKKRGASNGVSGKADVRVADKSVASVVVPVDMAAQRQRGRSSPAAAQQLASAPASAAKLVAAQNATGHSFSRLIPLVQQAIEACARKDGWATVSQVSKQLLIEDDEFTAKQYGFDTMKEAIGAIYSDWVESQKVGRGERVRVNKRYGTTATTEAPLTVVIPGLPGAEPVE